MFVIPGGRKVFTCISSVFIFTADIGVGSNESESFVIIPASHQFHSVSLSGSGGGDGFISQNTVVGSFRSQRNAVDDRHRIAVIMFVKPFGCEFKERGGTIFQSQSGLVAADILKGVSLVDIIPVVILKSHNGVRR